MKKEKKVGLLIHSFETGVLIWLFRLKIASQSSTTEVHLP